MTYEFSLLLSVNDPEQLRQAALRHPDADGADFLDADGKIDVYYCLVMLLDPGSLPGCVIINHIVEGS